MFPQTYFIVHNATNQINKTLNNLFFKCLPFAWQGGETNWRHRKIGSHPLKNKRHGHGRTLSWPIHKSWARSGAFCRRRVAAPSVRSCPG